jgi:tRNA U54 and U55 pseudouridine synthase Pus10
VAETGVGLVCPVCGDELADVEELAEHIAQEVEDGGTAARPS